MLRIARAGLLLALMALALVPATANEALTESASSTECTTASTTDGFTVHGVIDLPHGRPRGIVVFVPGSGAHTREYRFGRGSEGENRLIFRHLARRFATVGFASVRYDKRGMSCVGKTPLAEGYPCLDEVAARSMTWDTSAGDVESVFNVARKAPGGTCIIALAHSEGMTHVARLVEAHSISPSGIIGVGGVMEGFGSLEHWQWVDRLPTAIALADADHDGTTSSAEFISNIGSTPA